MFTLWDEVRRDLPGLAGQCYLNAAATSLTPRPVSEAVQAFYRELETGGDRHWDAWLERREAVRGTLARFVGADPDEIAFVPNTSTGMNLIADLLEHDGPVLSDELEFPAVTLPWIHRGVPVRFVAAAEGVLRLESSAVGQAPHAATLAISHVQFYKKRARLNIITHLLEHVPYETLTRKKVVLPARQKAGGYKESDHPLRFVAEKF